MTALEKAESALHRSGDVMDTGAACPPDFRPWPRDLGPLVTTPSRPVIAGVEATGEVLESGQGVALKPGTRVTVFLVDGAWRQEITMDAEQAVPVPDSHPDEIAAQTLVNPVTVLMLRRAAQQHFSVGFDGVVLNNAAASAVGRLFTAGAHHHQIVTISIVRNEARAEQLRDRFPEVPVVSADSPDWTARVPRRRFGTVDLRRARPPSGVKHPQTCCRAVQIADVAGEQFGAAYRTPGLGLCLQHRHAPARVGKHRRGDQPVVSGSDDDGVNHTATRWHRGSCFCAIVASRQVHSGCGAPPRAAAGCPVASAVDG